MSICLVGVGKNRILIGIFYEYAEVFWEYICTCPNILISGKQIGPDGQAGAVTTLFWNRDGIFIGILL